MTRHTFTFMGTGSGCGIPAFFCDCPACEEARKDPSVARGDCGVMIRGEKTLLIDTPPDIRHQLNREGIRSFDQLLYTHCHSDHVGGLLELEYMVQLLTKCKLPTYASEITLQHLAQEFDYMMYCLDAHAIEEYDTVEFDGVRYTALPVRHSPGTFGYLIETDETRLFYASDTGLLPDETKERIAGCDILAMDATFWKRCWNPNAHHSVQETIAEGLELGVKKIYLTHLALHYDEPITSAELDVYLEQFGGRVMQARDGMSFPI